MTVRGMSPALKAHLESDTPTWTWMLLFKRKWDGVYRGVTAWDRNLDFDLTVAGGGTVTYSAAPGFTLSNMQFLQGLGDQSASFDSAIDGSIFTVEELRGRAWHGSTYWAFIVNPLDLSMGAAQVDSGRMGATTRDGISFSMEILPVAFLLQRTASFIIPTSCTKILGRTDIGIGGGCPVRLFADGLWQASTAVAARQDRDAATGALVRPSVPKTGFSNAPQRAPRAPRSRSGTRPWAG